VYRALLAPILFDRVALRNETDSATSALGPSKSKHGQYVKQLRFEGSLDGNEYKSIMDLIYWDAEWPREIARGQVDRPVAMIRGSSQCGE
jgi:hypothetical protein